MADLTIREVLDQLRTYHAKNVKPFEKLPQVIEAAVQIIEHELPAAKRELDNLSEMLMKLRAETPDVEAAASASKERVQQANEAAVAAEREAQGRIGTAERAAAAREVQLTREWEHKGATLEREYTARADTLSNEIIALETKKAALDQAIAALRAKF